MAMARRATHGVCKRSNASGKAFAAEGSQQRLLHKVTDVAIQILTLFYRPAQRDCRVATGSCRCGEGASSSIVPQAPPRTSKGCSQAMNVPGIDKITLPKSHHHARKTYIIEPATPRASRVMTA